MISAIFTFLWGGGGEGGGGSEGNAKNSTKTFEEIDQEIDIFRRIHWQRHFVFLMMNSCVL